MTGSPVPVRGWRPPARRPLVKVCGITRVEDGRAAASAGADLVGFVFAPSRRRVTPGEARELAAALPARVGRVGVFVDAGFEEILAVAALVGLDAVQLHGGEGPALCRALGEAGLLVIKAHRLQGAADPVAAEARLGELPVWAHLFDTHRPDRPGGTGETFPWEWVPRSAVRRTGRLLFLAGGLNPENVAGALRSVQPDGVDVSTGVERAPGEKDPARVQAFVAAVRAPRAGGPAAGEDGGG